MEKKFSIIIPPGLVWVSYNKNYAFIEVPVPAEVAQQSPPFFVEDQDLKLFKVSTYTPPGATEPVTSYDPPLLSLQLTPRKYEGKSNGSSVINIRCEKNGPNATSEMFDMSLCPDLAGYKIVVWDKSGLTPPT